MSAAETAQSASSTIKSLSALAVGVIGAGVTISSAADPAITILICTFIFLGIAFAFWVMRHIEKQDALIAGCTQKHIDCEAKLRKRDILLAMLYHAPNDPRKDGGRRNADKMLFEMIMGEDAARTQEDLREFLAGDRS